MFNTILVYPLMNVLLAIYGWLPGHDFGVAVIILTAIIRLLLWPIVGKQLHSQKKLQQLQPEIARVRRETKGDKKRENQLMMELYKEKEINPFSSCLPLIIQLPFLIALFAVFRYATANFASIGPQLYQWVRGIPFIQQLIAHPAAFKPELFGVISMAKPNVTLALIAGISQYFQAKMLTPKTFEKGDQQAQMAKMMSIIFPVITVFIALRLPAALALYWTATTIIAIFQQWLIMRSETEKMEEITITKRVRQALPIGNKKAKK